MGSRANPVANQKEASGAELTDMVCPTLEFSGVSYLGNVLKALA